MTSHSPSKAAPWLVAVGSIAVLAVAVGLLWDWGLHVPDSDQKLARGTVMARDFTFVGPLRRPRLTVEVPGLSAPIQAILLVNSSNQVPDSVSLYVPVKDPTDVQLLEETSSLLAACFGAVIGLTGLFISFWLTVKRAGGVGARS